jgi:D-serine deaminase-like pyridoxal phosphate-dependent protein
VTPPEQTAGQDLYERYERAFAELQPPFAFVDLDALERNARDMVAMASGKPIRVASKSVRSTEVLRRVLAIDDAFRGLLTFTVPESLWLADQGFENLVCAYPTADRDAVRRLAELTEAEPERAPVLMVDSVEHLELIESAAGERVAPVRVAIEVDAGWWPLGGRVKIGPKRSPIRTPAQARALAMEIDRRAAVRLVGLMAYEGQVAGVGDDAPGNPLKNLAVRAMQGASMREIAERRAAVVAAVREVAPLEFVNGGGTGSLELTAAEDLVTEVTAGSGFYAPALFDHYSRFSLTPAAGFALPIVRKPAPSVATALGGGYLASGSGDPSRLPVPWLPAGLRLDPEEGGGEVQTPLLGSPAASLSIGDRAYLRHAKAGELCERFDALHLVEGGEIVDVAPTYRGEGKAFL